MYKVLEFCNINGMVMNGEYSLDFIPHVGYTYYGRFPANNQRKFTISRVTKMHKSSGYDYRVESSQS